MGYLQKAFLLVLGGLLVLCGQPAIAGGVVIEAESVTVESEVIRPGTWVTVDFDATDYEFGANNYKYMLFAIAPARSYTIKNPSAPKGILTKERAGVPSSYFRYLASDRTSPVQDDRDGPSHFTLRFQAPMVAGKYHVLYSRLPVFTNAKEGEADRVRDLIPISGTSGLGERSAFAGPFAGFVAAFTVSEAAAPPALTLYLRANGQQPAFANIRGGLVDEPLTFSWSLGPEVKLPAGEVLYRYKIWPVDADYSAWTHDQEVSFRFLPKGAIKFWVQAQYRNGTTVTTSAPATASFVLNEHLVANVTPGRTLKGPGKSFTDDGRPVAPTVAFESLYPRSRALIVGVHSFDDSVLPDFSADKIQKDVDTLENALGSNGFEVIKVVADRLNRDQIMVAIETFVNETKPDDRLLIYFSTHGFPDPLQQTAGWLATSDCQMANPTVKCIGLKDLEYQSQRALYAKAKQVLIAVDSCFSGLGVINKSSSPANFNMLAAKPGAFMLTAGMADQTAEIDNELGMSTFTYYLAEGLNGNAAIFDANGVITLTQLYAYVQYKVTERSKSRQTPMLGRLNGDGEMLFKPTLKP